MPSERTPPTFAEAFRFWLKLGFISFGGPSGQIAIMHEEVVERRKWISEGQFLHALNYCMLLPGPEATQLATYIGWLLHRTWGGIVAGTLFVLPSAVLLWGLSLIYVRWGTVPWIAAILYGLKPAVVALVAAAVVRIGRKALKSPAHYAMAAFSFVAIYFIRVPFPMVILFAASAGFLGERWRKARPTAPEAASVTAPEKISVSHIAELTPHTKPSLSRALRVTIVWLALWAAPVIALALWLGSDHTLVRQGIFFSKAATVTFGGAYAVLPYVSQQAVENYHWLTPAQMLDGLGLAETTPGPLIMVLQFVGFLGGWHHPGPLSPLLSATLGAFITTWTTFVPCFLWIFLGAPHIEQLRGNLKLTAALSAVTAAVVGVILVLALSFGQHVVLPDLKHVDWFAALVISVAFIGLWKWKWNVSAVVLGAGVAGLIFKMLMA
jgi:chromate transporter